MLHAATATPAGARGAWVRRQSRRGSPLGLRPRGAGAVSDRSVLRASGRNLPRSPLHLVRRLEADAKYSVYLDRQAEDVARYRRDDSTALPADLDYERLSGLSNEIKQKFIAVRPASLSQARRIEGVTPAALALIAAHARRAERAAGRDRLPAGT